MYQRLFMVQTEASALIVMYAESAGRWQIKTVDLSVVKVTYGFSPVW